MKLIAIILAVVSVLGTALSARADVITTYTFSSNTTIEANCAIVPCLRSGTVSGSFMVDQTGDVLPPYTRVIEIFGSPVPVANGIYDYSGKDLLFVNETQIDGKPVSVLRMGQGGVNGEIGFISTFDGGPGALITGGLTASVPKLQPGR